MTALLADEETTGLMTALLQINRSLHKPVLFHSNLFEFECVCDFLSPFCSMYIHKSEALHWHWRWGGAESRGNSGGGGPFSQFNSNVFKMSSNFTCLIYMVSCFCVTAIDAKLFRIHTRDK